MKCTKFLQSHSVKLNILVPGRGGWHGNGQNDTFTLVFFYFAKYTNVKHNLSRKSSEMFANGTPYTSV